MIKSIFRCVLVLVILLCAISGIATTETEPPRIDWDQAYPITWNLFQGATPADAIHRTEAAAIHMTIRWHASYSVASANGTNWTGQVTSITVTNTMDPSLSWVVPGKAYDDVLHHEQLHFDLNEVYRRKLECLLLETSACTVSTEQGAIDLLNASLHQTANALLLKLPEMQALYDSQTAHGNDSTEQVRWGNLINGWLAAPTTAP